MAIEIERKFLVCSDAWRAGVERAEDMMQIYLASAAEISIRVRITGPRAALNIKGCTVGARRQEFEFPVPVNEARELCAAFGGPRIEKTRHYLRHGGHLWEVDEFGGDNAGLVVAEIELEDEQEAFARPDWLGAEVTGEERYYNVCLATRPWREWPDAAR